VTVPPVPPQTQTGLAILGCLGLIGSLGCLSGILIHHYSDESPLHQQQRAFVQQHCAGENAISYDDCHRQVLQAGRKAARK